jgi:outer membrane protein
MALDNNPDLLAERERSKAARFDSKAAGAGRLPKISVFVTGDRTDYLGSYNQSPFNPLVTTKPLTAQAGVRATIPLFQGGLPAAQQRQAQAREGAQLETEIATEREVIAVVRTYYQQWQAAQAIIVSSQAAVDAAALSLEGVRAENTVGSRTILDILNAEQELLNAQVNLVQARHDVQVSYYGVLAGIGRLTARTLALPVEYYDEERYYNEVGSRWIGWGTSGEQGPKPQPAPTTTTSGGFGK